MSDTILINVTEDVIDITIQPESVVVTVADPETVGPPGATIQDAYINSNDNLEFQLTNGTTIVVDDLKFSGGQYTSSTSNTPMSIGRAAYIKNGLVAYLDNQEIENAFLFYGIVSSSGTNIQVQTSGIFTDMGLSLVLTEPIYVGNNGFLSQIPPLSGFSLVIGYPVTTNSFLIQKSQPIFLS